MRISTPCVAMIPPHSRSVNPRVIAKLALVSRGALQT
jgi:hypothetical protein